jgi:integrase
MPGHVRNMGKRKDGSTRWQARWRHPSDPRIREERVFRMRRDAERYIARQETTAHDGSWINSHRSERPFCEVYEAWTRSWPGRLQASTTQRYEETWRVHIEPALGAKPTNTVTHEAIQRFIDGKRDAGIKPPTLRKLHAVLSAIFTEAVRLGVVPVNPAKHIRLPRAPKRTQLFLVPEQIAKLADGIEPHYRLLIITAAYTGLRFGELAALRRSDLDPLHATLKVERALKQDGSFGPTKTHAVRTIKLPAFLAQLLADHAAGLAPEALLFMTKRGHALGRHVFYRRVFKPAVRAALPKQLHGFRFHDLRHTAAGLMLSNGAHLLQVKERLGHESITTTADHYGHIAPALGDALADALDAAYKAEPTDNVTPLRRAAE